MIRKISIFLLFSLLFSCGENDNSYVLYSGNIKNTTESTMKITNFFKSFEKDILVDKAGNFSDTLFIKEEGTYYYKIGRSYNSMFLRKGYNLRVSLDADDFYKSTKYSGEGSLVNNYSVARGALKGSFVGDAKEYFVVPIADFMLKIEKEKTAFLALLEQAGLEKEDNEFQRKIIENDYLQTRNSYDRFNFYHTQQHPVVPEDYYEPIKKMDISDEESFMNDKSYMNMVIENWRLKSADALKNDPNFSIIEYTKLHVKNLKSTKIKDYITSMLFKQMNAKNENLEKDYIEIMAMLSADNMKEKLTQKHNSVLSTKPEMTSIGFDYENHAGGKTTLKDLRGKLVYIEIWATWCGPCVKEMPFLTDLIKEYKNNKNIAFVSISIDNKNEYEKWRTMVPLKNVGGIQLLADKGLESEFMKNYSVGLIPRSIMLDTEGNIISQHAPRPSSKDIRTFIDENLNKKTMGNTLIKPQKNGEIKI